jgi:hypothetical protein
VAAADSRRRSPTVHLLLRSGLRVFASGETPLGGAVPPTGVVTAPVAALPRRQVVAVTEGNALDPLFDDDGYSRVAGTAALLPTGPTTPEVVRELAAAGVRAVLVDGPIPAGSLGVDEPVEVPIVGIPTQTAAQVRATLAAGMPVELAVGAAEFDANPALRAVDPFSSTGLALDGGARPALAAPGVGLVTSVPGRSEGGAARYGTISGSSAAAAVVAGAAALLADARPDLDAGALRGALVATAQRGVSGAGTGLVDLQAASSAELVADPPVAALGALVAAGTPATGTVRLRNVSRRPLAVRLRQGASTTGVRVTMSRERVVLQPGAARDIAVTVEAAVRPAAPGALAGAIRASVPRGPRLRIPWSVAVPVTREPVVSRVRLSSRSFRASDTRPAVLALVAGRVDGSRERPQLLPLELLDIELYRGPRRIGRLARLRDLLPGRYAFGLTGRGPGGARLPRGEYLVRVIGTPVGGGPPTSVDVAFRLR